MSPSTQILLDSAFTVYDSDELPSGDYHKFGNAIVNEFGLYAVIYRKTGTHEYILSFRGTQKPNSWDGVKDWINNFNDGFPQYARDKEKLATVIDDILANNGNSRIHIVGHSLGGALAQFTAYDLAKRNNGALNHRFTLTTWNALGGGWGLKRQSQEFNPRLMDGVAAIHYYRLDDLVARFGGDHIGGKKVVLIDPEKKLEFFYSAHMKPELQQALMSGTQMERKPAYFYVDELSRDTFGGILSLFIKIAGGSIDPRDTKAVIKHIFLSTWSPVKTRRVADLVKIIATLGAEIAAHTATQSADAIRDALLERVDEIKLNPHLRKQFIEGLLASVLPASGIDIINKAIQAFAPSLLRGVSDILRPIGDQSSSLLSKIAEILQSSSSGIPLGMGDVFLNLFSSRGILSKLGLGLFRETLLNEFIRARNLPATQWFSPIILDLDHDGVETVGNDWYVYFDHDGNRFAEQTGWVFADDALLVCDRNRDGKIDSGAELFGSFTPGPGGLIASDGFAALIHFDGNNDLIVNASDPLWAELLLWQDKNINASVDDGELKSLDAHGISDLHLSHVASDFIDPQGNEHRLTGSYTRTDGSVHKMTDVWFSVDYSDTNDLVSIPLDPELHELPEVNGMGNVPSLRQAIQRDTSGKLKRLLEQWFHSSSHDQNKLITPLLYQWTGVSNLVSHPEPFLDDRRKLAAVESLLGMRFNQGQLISIPLQATMLQNLFKQLERYVATSLNSAELLPKFLPYVRFAWDQQLGKNEWILDEAINYLLKIESECSVPRYLSSLGGGIRNLGSTGADLLAAFRHALYKSPQIAINQLRWLLIEDAQFGSAGDDWLWPRYDEPTGLIGEAGNDTLVGYSHADLLDGGLGNDRLEGGWGSDVYMFSKDFGLDIIVEPSMSIRDREIAIFLSHRQSDLTSVDCLQGDLRLHFLQGDVLTIQQYFGSSALNALIEEFRFADGVTWGVSDVLSQVFISGSTSADDRLGGYRDTPNRIDGLAGNDILLGANLADDLHGNLGNDTLSGAAGSDRLRGGKANDSIDGGLGRDHIFFAVGDGLDTIHTSVDLQPDDRDVLIFEAGIRPSDVQISRDIDRNHLLINLPASGDQIRVRDFLYFGSPSQSRNPLHEVRFSDGTTWGLVELTRRTTIGGSGNDEILGTDIDDIIIGNGGHDLLFGYTGNDTLDGGDGDDLLHGGLGNDQLRGGLGRNRFPIRFGDGHDMIMADAVFSGPYQAGVLEFDSSIHPDSCRYEQVGNDLVIRFGTSSDSLTIQDFFWGNNPANIKNPISVVHFMATGSFRPVDQLVQPPPTRILGSPDANQLIGTSAVDIISGLAGDDLLDGRDGDDQLDGGDGQDTLIGGAGNDLLQGGAGDDTVSFGSAPGVVRVDLSLAGAQYTISAGWDTFVSIENLIGSAFADVLRGNALANRIEGGLGDDTLDGGAGDDTLSYANASSGVTVSLSIITPQATGGAGTDTILGFEHLHGSRFADVLTGSVGANSLQGGEGNDVICGSLGPDRHSGGAGADQFLYRSEAEAGNGVEGRDWILDFQNEDCIDLRAIDANPSRSGDQAFSWIGTNAFKSPGQLRYTLINGVGLLEGNTIGNSVAEFQIALQGGLALRSGVHVLL